MNVRTFDRMKLPFERGLNIYEGLALIREIPALIDSGVVLAGSRFDIDQQFPCVAKIGKVGDTFNLIHVYDSAHFRKSGIATCGVLND
jgi:hypothetical protein